MNTLRLKWRGNKLLLVAASVCILSVVGIAFAQTGNGFNIKSSSIDGGAASMDDGVLNGYVLRGTIGQPEGREGVLTGGVYTLQGGITILPAPVVIPPSGNTVAPGRNYFIDPSVTFRWTKVTYALGYWIEIARDKNFTQIVTSVNTLPATQLTYPFSLPGNGTYYWRVRAKSKVTPLTWGPPSVVESLVVSIP